MQKELEVKKRNLLILMILSLLAVSCTFGPPDPNQWIKGKSFRGQVSLAMTGEETRKQEWEVRFDHEGHMIPEQFLTVEKDVSYSLEDNVLKLSQIIVYNDNGARCTRDITIEKLPNRKIRFHEVQKIIVNNDVLERSGTMNEMM